MKSYDILIKSCVENAHALFKELKGEFYPFAYIFTHSNEAIPYYVHFADDFPNVNDVLRKLSTSLIKDIFNDGKYLQGAVCALSTKNVDGFNFEFLDIKTLNNIGEAKDYVAIIETNYENYTFEIIENIEETGTIYAFNLQ